MFDRIFAPALTFLMLIGGTAAIASGLFATPRADVEIARTTAPDPAASPLMLDKVVVVVKRADAQRALADWDRHQQKPGGQAAEGRGVMLHQPHD